MSAVIVSEFLPPQKIATADLSGWADTVRRAWVNNVRGSRKSGIPKQELLITFGGTGDAGITLEQAEDFLQSRFRKNNIDCQLSAFADLWLPIVCKAETLFDRNLPVINSIILHISSRVLKPYEPQLEGTDRIHLDNNCVTVPMPGYAEKVDPIKFLGLRGLVCDMHPGLFIVPKNPQHEMELIDKHGKIVIKKIEGEATPTRDFQKSGIFAVASEQNLFRQFKAGDVVAFHESRGLHICGDIPSGDPVVRTLGNMAIRTRLPYEPAVV